MQRPAKRSGALTTPLVIATISALTRVHVRRRWLPTGAFTPSAPRACFTASTLPRERNCGRSIRISNSMSARASLVLPALRLSKAEPFCSTLAARSPPAWLRSTAKRERYCGRCRGTKPAIHRRLWRRWAACGLCSALRGMDCIGADPANGSLRFEFPWRARMQASVNAAAPLVVGRFRLHFCQLSDGGCIAADRGFRDQEGVVV